MCPHLKLKMTTPIAWKASKTWDAIFKRSNLCNHADVRGNIWHDDTMNGYKIHKIILNMNEIVLEEI